MSARPEVPRLDPKQVLAALAARSCETFTTGPGSCFRAGRVILSAQGCDAVCDGCLAYAAINREEPTDG